jgi:hypothetical protein
MLSSLARKGENGMFSATMSSAIIVIELNFLPSQAF